MDSPTIDDILGIEQTKLGYFQAWQEKLQELRDAHALSERQRKATAVILDGITDLIMVLDEDLHILRVNKVFEDLFPGREYWGVPCYSLFRGADDPCPECPALLSLQNGAVTRETAIFPINGSTLHFDMIASLLPPSPGSRRSVLVSKRDVTREKRLLGQIYQAEKMASVGTLAAGVAHEINNPLTAVTGFAEGIRRRLSLLHADEGVMADLTEYTDTILHECARCRDIVQALLNFSRPLPSRTLISLDSMIRETLSLLHHTVKRYDRVVFCLDCDADLPHIWANETQVRQVVLNLLTNALDALRQSGNGDIDGAVTIRTRQDGRHVILDVEDTGVGISPRHLSSVFEPFFTTKPQGLGLGLSVCYSVIHAHGGEITLTNDPDKRTRVRVRLPLQGPEAVLADGVQGDR